MEFESFGKIARLSREITVTEKIDGTNAQVSIRLAAGGLAPFEPGIDIQVDIAGLSAYMRAGSRTRWISVTDDNYGFAKWVYANAHELVLLGEGNHFGEWWGSGIQRNYSQTQKRFSLFNTSRWSESRPDCCDVVPVLYSGVMDEYGVMKGVKTALNQLRDQGSVAAPGFMKPEGIVIYHHAANLYFKKTLDKDEEWKGKQAA